MATGDIIIEDNQSGILTTAQRTALRAIVDQLWTGPFGAIDEVVFRRNSVTNDVEFMVRGGRSVAPANVPNRNLVIRGREP